MEATRRCSRRPARCCPPAQASAAEAQEKRAAFLYGGGGKPNLGASSQNMSRSSDAHGDEKIRQARANLVEGARGTPQVAKAAASAPTAPLTKEELNKLTAQALKVGAGMISAC